MVPHAQRWPRKRICCAPTYLLVARNMSLLTCKHGVAPAVAIIKAAAGRVPCMALLRLALQAEEKR